MKSAKEPSLDPAAHGFVLEGWAVRLADGRYVREVRVFVPDAGVVTTRREIEAMT